jgi:DNA-binding IclR family transcriptional regulator
MRAGTVMSLLGTATGRAFAAVLPPERIEQALAGPLGELREAPRSTRRERERELRETIAEVRAQGLARAVGRPIPGVNAFSAPAFDHEGEPVLVITALGHQDHFPADWDSPAADAVRRAAREISLRLGWRAAAAPT